VVSKRFFARRTRNPVLKVTYPIVLGDSKVSKGYGMGDLLPATFLIDRTLSTKSLTLDCTPDFILNASPQKE